MLDTLDVALQSSGKKDAIESTIFRIARSLTNKITIPDVMKADGTRQSISPVMFKASDIIMVRLNAPSD
jgi:hypothetical protein